MGGLGQCKAGENSQGEKRGGLQGKTQLSSLNGNKPSDEFCCLHCQHLTYPTNQFLISSLTDHCSVNRGRKSRAAQRVPAPGTYHRFNSNKNIPIKFWVLTIEQLFNKNIYLKKFLTVDRLIALSARWFLIKSFAQGDLGNFKRSETEFNSSGY